MYKESSDSITGEEETGMQPRETCRKLKIYETNRTNC